jgi:hypothetical protein
MITATAVAALWLTGCGFPDRRGAAESIGAAIRAMPGVADTDVGYDTSFDGGAHFHLTVTLSGAASNEQGAAVARTFVEQMIAADFRHFDVRLDLAYQRAGADAARSLLSVDYYPSEDVQAGMSADAVAESATWWLDVARSSGVADVTVSLPLDNIYADVTRPLWVTLPVDADDAVLTDLIRRHPQLNSAVWSVALPSPKPPSQPRSYDSRGRFLDRHSRQVWQRIVDQLGPFDGAKASTQIPPQHGLTPTTVEIGWGFDYGRDNDLERIARGVSPLLTELPGPVRFQLNTRVQDPASGDVVDRDLTITIGGCTPPDPKYNHPAVPLEAKLRHLYESC